MLRSVYDHDYMDTYAVVFAAKENGIELLHIDIDTNNDGVEDDQERLDWQRRVYAKIAEVNPDYVETYGRAKVARILGVPNVDDSLRLARTNGTLALWARDIDKAIRKIRDEHNG